MAWKPSVTRRPARQDWLESWVRVGTYIIDDPEASEDLEIFDILEVGKSWQIKRRSGG